ncbi:Prenyltransferase [Desulfovibrio sp. DV]|uniref:decaprenyl-phosphate phosphoribosyltransferase n=1 Tax=Desulfovibrio sp. DV TaxID=1844708 RepID=UPI00094BA33B|nr:decaprenyl-phosphate phosphoribosyltransferase [Desulfovibrio sp. DV]OLN30837.1 Prenyltransferase [Desulfovibrio sp. DV]
MSKPPSRPASFLKLARPHQYIKNAFVFLPLFFGWKLTDPAALYSACLAFAAFCLAASAVYVVNDLKDIEEDRAHPTKRNRPLASGALTPGQGLAFAGVLLAGSAGLTALLGSGGFCAILAGYLAINGLYSFGLKHKSLIDLACIAIGFVLRVFAGGVVTGITPSHWIVLMTFLLALFLGFAKRRDDLLLSAAGCEKTRRSLDGYNLEFVTASMMLMAAVVIVSYILYTLSPEVIAKHGSDKLYLTTIFVILGVLRYLQITLVECKSGSPTLVLLRDGFIQASLVLWIVSFYLILYVERVRNP